MWFSTLKLATYHGDHLEPPPPPNNHFHINTKFRGLGPTPNTNRCRNKTRAINRMVCTPQPKQNKVPYALLQ